MAIITEAAALIVLPLAIMKDELRITQTETSHDALLTRQIVDAVSFVSKAASATTDDERMALRMAAVSVCRDLYNGNREVSEHAAHDAWLAPFRSYETE